jgi:hypothetical protein
MRSQHPALAVFSPSSYPHPPSFHLSQALIQVHPPKLLSRMHLPVARFEVGDVELFGVFVADGTVSRM